MGREYRKTIRDVAVALAATVGALSLATAAQADLSITKTADRASFTAVGQTITYTYTLTATGGGTFHTISIDDDLLGHICSPGTFVAPTKFVCYASYTIVASDLTKSAITNVATVTGTDPDFIPLTGLTDTVSVTNAVPTPTPTPTPAPPDPSAGIPPFLDSRIIAILHDEPDRPRFIRRFTGTLWKQPQSAPAPGPVPVFSSYAPVDVNMSGSGGTGQLSMSTSLQQVLAYNEKRDDGGVAGAAPLAPAAGSGPVDVWTEAHAAFGTGRQDLRFGSWYLGADYLVRPSVLVGVLTEADWTKQRLLDISGVGEGTGWMVGPYASVHLAPHLYLDGRFAWGQSTNTIATSGATDKFNTDRFLARVNLTGNWQRGDWRFTPSAALAYVTETQNAYTGSGGSSVPSHTASIGRLTAGPEVAKRIVMANGTVVEPMASVVFDWDFATSGQTSSIPALSASAIAAVMATRPSGVTMRGALKYGGIGTSDWQTLGVQFWVSVPLN